MSKEQQEIRKFVRGGNKKYSLKEKGWTQTKKKYKSEYDDYVMQNQNRINYSDKLKRHTEKLPKEGYMERAVWEFYSDLKMWNITILTCQMFLNSESDALIV